ncbi:PD-(D/E)XK motif protein [Kitasatospora sp. NPDC058965]|uniref:PD-(D/E)XK motif protein n=1 Tax=Kitasatospora sp. NPDC058965 TaxID=3346682 RepID=UPI0036BB9E1F
MERLWARLDKEALSRPSELMLTGALEIATPHGLVRLGRDAEGRRHLLVPVARLQRVDDDRRSVGVHLTSRVLLVDDLPVRFADLVCRRQDLSGVFTGLVADLCAQVAVEPDDAPAGIARTLSAWRLLLGSQSGRWTMPRLAGLFAELTVLEELLTVSSEAARTWHGPTGSAHDFRTAHHAIEVKASTTAGGRTVRIHGVDQLEAPAGGSLHLAWFRVAARAGNEGRTVLDLVESCRARASTLDILDERLSALGINASLEPVFAEARFESTDEQWYEVDHTFPRIIPTSFAEGAVPSGVSSMEYLVDLDNVPARADRLTALDRLASEL